MNKHAVMTGNEAAAEAARCARPRVISAYPITPQTGIIEALSQFVADGTLPNCSFIPVESEHSALAALIGAAQEGARTFTATSSQGLLLMHEMLQWASGARLPIVMVNVNRAVGPPWNIWCDQTDSLSQRDTGWIQIYCQSNQEVFDSTLQAFWIAEHAMLPVMVCLDGFLLSHTAEPVEIPDQEIIDRFLEEARIPHALSNEDPRSIGASGNPRYYFELKRNVAHAYRRSISIIRKANVRYQKFFGKSYDFFGSYRLEDAEIVLVTTGSITTIAKDAIDLLRSQDIPVGLLNMRVFRPMPRWFLKKAIPPVKKIIVFDYDQRGIVYDELKAALYPNTIPLVGYTVGVGGVETPAEFIADLVRKAVETRQPVSSFSKWRVHTPSTTKTSSGNAVEVCSSSPFVQTGHRACGGCTATLVMRHVLDVFGENTQIAMPACCWSIIAGPNPYTPVKVPLLHCAFETGAATASGMKRAAEQLGKHIYAIAFAGDGGTFDIGLQALSGAAERGEDIVYICYDNEAYMNTGGQRSSATPQGAVTETTPVAKTEHKKDILKIMAAHGVVYAASASIYFLEDLKQKLRKAKEYEGKGLRFLHILAPCNPGWKISPELSLDIAFLAVETNVFPLVEYEQGKWRITHQPQKDIDIMEYLGPQGRFAELIKDEDAVQKIRDDVNAQWHELKRLEQL